MVHELVKMARSELARAPFAPSPREAYLLLGHALGLSETQVLARWHEQVEATTEERFRRLLERRLNGEPVAYLLGRREFYGRIFGVDRRVLIPRPETEHLVEAALALDLPPNPKILDLGTGSGCLAVTLALEIEGASVTAIDIAPGALAVARNNIRDLARPDESARIRLVAADLAGPIALERFDLAVSNPPYLGRDEEDSLSPEIRDFEPHRALFAGRSADSTIVRLVTELAPMRSGTHLLFEIGHRQERLVRRHLERSCFELIEMIDDYQGIPRVAVARRV